MRKLILASFLLLASKGWASVGFVTVASSGVVAALTSATVTLSPTPGDTIVAVLGTAVTASAVSVADNNGNPLTAGPTNTNQFTFYGTAVTGATSYTASWTGTSTVWFDVAEYSGVGSVNASLTGNTTSGTSTSASMSCTTLIDNSWLIVLFKDSTTTSWTATSGNKRIGNTAAPSGRRCAIMDNTSATAGSLTCASTLSASLLFAGVCLELDPPVASTGQGSFFGIF